MDAETRQRRGALTMAGHDSVLTGRTGERLDGALPGDRPYAGLADGALAVVNGHRPRG